MLAVLPFPDIDPILISFQVMGRTIAIHWYAIAYISGFLCAWAWMNFEIKRLRLWNDHKPPMTAKHVEDLLTWMIVGTILGGRLGYVLFYQFDAFLADPGRILRLWEGGMSFHGGFLGVIIAGLFFCRRAKLDAWSVGDLIASGACFGLFFGRIANFINAELWGRPTDVPWAVAFPTQAAQECGQLLPVLCGRHPSQLYEAALEGPILFAIMAFLIFKRDWFKVPGQIIGVFLIGYGIARVIVEGVRQADPQFITLENPMGYILSLGDFGLTMGQSLSIPMILIGIAVITIARKPRA
jgi:phosphatidylglycerol:prolipoprotein diacylglycerol transferase